MALSISPLTLVNDPSALVVERNEGVKFTTRWESALALYSHPRGMRVCQPPRCHPLPTRPPSARPVGCRRWARAPRSWYKWSGTLSATPISESSSPMAPSTSSMRREACTSLCSRSECQAKVSLVSLLDRPSPPATQTGRRARTHRYSFPELAGHTVEPPTCTPHGRCPPTHARHRPGRSSRCTSRLLLR